MMRACASRLAALVLAISAASAPWSAAAAQSGPALFQAEERLDVLAGTSTAVHAAAGANVAMGLNVRIAMLLGAGVRRVGDMWEPSGALTAIARFHFDPLMEFRYGLYAGGGGTLLADRGAPTRVRTVVVIGIDGPASRARWITGAELGLGGGVRIGVTLRRSRRGAR